jgi:nucleotide-binding universal stress UspA family protein
VCGVSDVRADEAVVSFAANVVKQCGGRLILLHIQPLPLIAAEPQIAFAAPQPRPATDLVVAARRLARLTADADLAPESEVRVAFGDLEEQLLAAARDEQADVVVVGSQPGSNVINGAPCPVAVVPVGSGRATASGRSGWGRQRMASASVPGDALGVSSTKGEDVTSSILTGVDDSPHARLALRHAARVADVLDLPLIVAHVVRPPLPPPRFGPPVGHASVIPVDVLLASGHALLEKILDEEGLEHAERRVTLGFPADRLADLADAEAAELIVVGSRGRGAVKAAIFGSVSKDLVGVARRPVLVIPPRAEPPSADRAQTTAPSLASAA